MQTNIPADEELSKFSASLLDESAATLDERVRIMKKERFRLLDELHAKQQALDCLDCIIRKIKSGGCICR